MNTFKDLASLTKPRLSLLVVLTTAAGVALAPGVLMWFEWLALMLGATAVVGAANAINCLLEVDVDAQMQRTQNRPLVQKRLSSRQALIFGMSLALGGSFLLAFAINWITAFLGLLGFVLYVGVYTPMKKTSPMALFAGAVPGALPPMMGWTAVSGRLDLGAWILFGLLFFWQLPHFLAIALFYKDQYANAGLKTYPVQWGEKITQLHMRFYALVLLLFTLLPYSMGMAGPVYFLTALGLGMVFMALCVLDWFGIRPMAWTRTIFIGSLIYLPLILGIWVFEENFLRGVL